MIRNFHKATDDIASSAIQAGGSIASSAIGAANPLGWIDSVANAVAGIFNGLFDLGKTRNTNSANTAQTYWLVDSSKDKSTKNPLTGFYIIVGVMLVAVVLAIFLNNKNSK